MLLLHIEPNFNMKLFRLLKKIPNATYLIVSQSHMDLNRKITLPFTPFKRFTHIKKLQIPYHVAVIGLFDWQKEVS